jgi:DNA-binding IclR family transcriptional regulator
LLKGLEILELLSTTPEPMTLTEIARALGRSSGEQFRMLAVLQQLGYIRRESGGAFRPTLKLFCLAQQIRPVEQLLQAARGPMRRYSEATGQECHLSTLEDGRLVVLAQQAGTHAVTLFVRPGSVHHPAHTISGRLLLAQLPEEEMRWHLCRASEHFATGIASRASLKKGIREVRGHSIGRTRDESLKGVADTAVVLGGRWPVALASSCFYATFVHAKQDSIEECLIEVAESIQREMGA